MIFNPSKISKNIFFNEKKIFQLKNISKIYILRISRKYFLRISKKKQRKITISGG
jgi:hypothetical protein